MRAQHCRKPRVREFITGHVVFLFKVDALAHHHQALSEGGDESKWVFIFRGNLDGNVRNFTQKNPHNPSTPFASMFVVDDDDVKLSSRFETREFPNSAQFQTIAAAAAATPIDCLFS